MALLDGLAVVVVADDVAPEAMASGEVGQPVPGEHLQSWWLEEVGARARDGGSLLDDDDALAAAAQHEGEEAAAETGADDGYVARCGCHDESPFEWLN
ncbi:hypothetical protein GCM10020216_001190 [Nonomuraea helvata]